MKQDVTSSKNGAELISLLNFHFLCIGKMKKDHQEKLNELFQERPFIVTWVGEKINTQCQCLSFKGKGRSRLIKQNNCFIKCHTNIDPLKPSSEENELISLFKLSLWEIKNCQC